MDRKTTEIERKRWVEYVFNAVNANDEDMGFITSHSFNFPTVSANGEEYWVEVSISIPKDGGDDGYLKREQYADTVAKREARAAEKAKKTEKKKGE